MFLFLNFDIAVLGSSMTQKKLYKAWHEFSANLTPKMED
jgi:hypothetical protein